MISCFIFITSGISASTAGVLMSWDGVGIISKASIQDFWGNGQLVHIVNNITDAYNTNDDAIHAILSLRKYEWWGYTTAQIMHQYGKGTASWTYSTGDDSNYYMYFQSYHSAYDNPLDMNGYIY